MSAIDPRTEEGVAHVARLARLALTSDESTAMQGHLAKILTWVDELNQLDTEGVSANAHDQPRVGGLRLDAVVPSLPREESLQNAPSRSETGFTVPAVIASE